jgi:hypothetical protein
MLVGGCGGQDGPDGDTPVAEKPPACASGTAPIPRPGGIPAAFPFPAGMIFTSAERPVRPQLIVRGLAGGDLEDVATFFSKRLPPAGFRIGLGDSEPGEAEAPFTGHGYRGKWKVNEIPTCPGGLLLTFVFIVQP